MKVLSIRQPWASLIINGFKDYEFRSWHTNFRGKILIHASKDIETNRLERFKHLNLDYPTGVIIGSVEITDCIEVNKIFEDTLINDNELVYGATKNKNGYAFKMIDIRKFKEPIKAIGQLGIWNYYNENDVMNLMSNIKYGWLDKENNKHLIVNGLFSENYILQSPKETLKNEIGVCWDQVELERYYFKSNELNIKTYFLCHYDNDKCPTHTFLTYEKNNYYYWFEHSWEKYKGLHKYNNLKELLTDVRNKFIETELNNIFESNNLMLYEYGKPKYGISVLEFYKHCENGYNINIDKL